MPDTKLATLRQQYQNACGYCGVTETSIGGELTIDHFRPKSAGGGEDVDNLVYACIKCNQFKGDFWPKDEHLAQGKRVLHPLLDDLTVHVKENEQTGRLDPLSETGRFHITLLKLNRPQLIEHRLVRYIQIVVAQKQLLLEQQNADFQKTLELQERYITMLETRLRNLLGS